jgi:hypothetical protein
MKGLKGSTLDNLIYLALFFGVASSGVTMFLACVVAVIEHQIAVAAPLLFSTYACVIVAHKNLNKVKL